MRGVFSYSRWYGNVMIILHEYCNYVFVSLGLTYCIYLLLYYFDSFVELYHEKTIRKNSWYAYHPTNHLRKTWANFHTHKFGSNIQCTHYQDAIRIRNLWTETTNIRLRRCDDYIVTCHWYRHNIFCEWHDDTSSYGERICEKSYYRPNTCWRTV